MKRIEGEEFDVYQVRRREENLRIKNMLKGKLWWPSKNTMNRDERFNKGTYRKSLELI